MEDRQRKRGEEEEASPKRSPPRPTTEGEARGGTAPSGLPRTRAPPWGILPRAPLGQLHPWTLEKKEARPAGFLPAH